MEITSYLLGKNAGGGGITPTGTISITENGEHDVTNYASANVNVSGGGTAKTLADVNEALDGFYDYIESFAGTGGALSDDNVTLYSPNSDYKRYFIINRGFYYDLYWIAEGENIVKESNNKLTACYLINDSNDRKKLKYAIGTSFVGYKYTKDVMPSLNTIMNVMKDPNTSISDYNYNTSIMVSGDIYCGNVAVVNLPSEDISSPKKVSSNETIGTLQ